MNDRDVQVVKIGRLQRRRRNLARIDRFVFRPFQNRMRLGPISRQICAIRRP